MDDDCFYKGRNVCKGCVSEYGKERYSNTVGYSDNPKLVKEIRKCIICGELSTLKLSSSFTQPKETYKCKRCALKIVNSKRVAGKEKWNCVGCGKLSSLTLLSKFKSRGVTKETYMCQSCRVTKLWTDENYRLKQDAAFAARSNNIDWQNKMSERNKQLPNNPLWKTRQTAGLNKYWSDPNSIIVATERNRKLSLDPSWLNSVKLSGQKLALDPVWIDKITIVNQSIEKRVRSSATAQGIPIEEWLQFAINGKYCGKWGDPRYKVRKRVRARFDNRCIICGRTFEQNNNKHMHVHHVYRKKDACCDGEKADWLFATLCDTCHGKYGKRQIDVLYIREILSLEYGNKCMLSLEEYNKLYPEGSEGNKRWGSANGR
jgi:transcription elongation factor Elf1